MVIKNLKKLAKTPARTDALAIIEAGYQAIRIDHLARQTITVRGDVLSVEGHDYNLKNYRHVYVVGVGKGSALLARQVEKLVGHRRIKRGFVIDVTKQRLRRIKSLVGSHPLPSDKNIKATNRIIKLLQAATKDDLVITLICGGGSALFCQPGSLTCLEMQFVSNHLLKAGATIQQINTVRKHLSLIHGGGMAKYAYPATILSLIISDVPGDDLSMVSSGPTVLDETTKSQAEQVAKRFGLPPIELLETPKDPRYFRRVTNVLIGSGTNTVIAMAAKARELGYSPRIVSRHLHGLAKEIGPALVQRVAAGQALLACGETEVIVTRAGKGGRNQDVVVAAMPQLKPGQVIISAASDGRDNVPVAGGLADGDWTTRKLKRLRINPDRAVSANQSYRVLHKLKDHLFINKITANVSDFVLALGPKR